MARDVEHICDISDKWCKEGADSNRHPDHDSHMGGCICPLGEEKLWIPTCIECDSPNLLFAGVVCRFDIQKQQWVYDRNDDMGLYNCEDCGEQSLDRSEIEYIAQ